MVFRRETALVTTDVTFEPPSGARSVFVAYASPGLPTAFSAELLAVPEARFAPADDARGAFLSSAHAVRAPTDAWLSLGPATSAGRVVALDPSAVSASNTTLVALRLRAVHALDPRAAVARSVVARISRDGVPLPLGEVHVHAEAATLVTASAALCASGREELGVALTTTPSTLPPPLRARRDTREDLCVRAILR